MDKLYVLHLIIMSGLFSIPVWPQYYLQYGVYIPLLLAASWIIFNGCPLTKVQTNIKSKSFTREIYDFVVPGISVKQAEHTNTFMLIGITLLACKRLK